MESGSTTPEIAGPNREGAGGAASGPAGGSERDLAPLVSPPGGSALGEVPSVGLSVPSSPSAPGATILSDAWARHFHDDIAQYLTALMLGLRTLRAQCTDPAPQQTIASMEALADKMNRELYHVIDRLREVRTGGDLTADLRQIASAWEGYGSLRVDISLVAMEGMSLSLRARDAIVGIVKEAVTNAARHAGVGTVKVRGSTRPGVVRIAIVDKGSGFGSPKLPVLQHEAGVGGHGLRGMYEHARGISAMLLIRSRPGRGTTVLLDVPLGEKR